MSLTGIDEKRLDALLDDADGVIRQVKGKLDLIDAPMIAGAICALNQTAANLLAVSETLKKLAEKFNAV